MAVRGIDDAGSAAALYVINLRFAEDGQRLAFLERQDMVLVFQKHHAFPRGFSGELRMLFGRSDPVTFFVEPRAGHVAETIPFFTVSHKCSFPMREMGPPVSFQDFQYT